MKTGGPVSRRGFLNGTTASVVAAGMPLWFAREAAATALQDAEKAKKAAAEPKAVMAAIGTGSEARP